MWPKCPLPRYPVCSSLLKSTWTLRFKQNQPYFTQYKIPCLWSSWMIILDDPLVSYIYLLHLWPHFFLTLWFWIFPLYLNFCVSHCVTYWCSNYLFPGQFWQLKVDTSLHRLIQFFLWTPRECPEDICYCVHSSLLRYFFFFNKGAHNWKWTLLKS